MHARAIKNEHARYKKRGKKLFIKNSRPVVVKNCLFGNGRKKFPYLKKKRGVVKKEYIFKKLYTDLYLTLRNK